MKLHWALDVMLYLLGLCFNITLLVLVVYLVYTYAIKGFHFGEDFSEEMTAAKPDREVEFVLAEDTPVSEAARRLEDMNVIGNQYLFRLELFLKGSSTIYRAGTYTLNQNMSNTDVNATLRKKPVEVVPDNVITIPEGYSIRDIAVYLENKEFMTAEEFITACETHDFNYWFLQDLPERANRLEGYLFPDTYFISAEPTPDEVINKMLSRFNEIFTGEYRERAEERNMTVDQVITVAAIIEKEVRRSDERPKVSQVIFNRLDQGIPLQMCSTVLYVLDKKKDRLLDSDLEVESPYNTYIYGGLPVGPIANPGADCIRAALYPEDGNLLYFVLQNEETGEHYFTHSYDDFLAAKERYNQRF